MSQKLDPGTLLMPKATAVWLIDNTALTFEQIAEFTGLHTIEVQALADEEVGRGIVGRDPIVNGELSKEELERCEKDSTASLKLSKSNLPPLMARSKGPRYTPVSKRGDKPDAVAFLLKHFPDLSDAQICRLIGTTKPTIAAVRDRTHANSASIKPRHPADLGLCTYRELEDAHRKALKAAGKDPDQASSKPLSDLEDSSHMDQSDSSSSDNSFAGFDFSNFMKKEAGQS